jgi:hypothetical protein
LPISSRKKKNETYSESVTVKYRKPIPVGYNCSTYDFANPVSEDIREIANMEKALEFIERNVLDYRSLCNIPHVL